MFIHTTLAIVLALAFQVSTGGSNPTGQASGLPAVSLGRVTITQPVLANGTPLPPGAYEIRLIGESLAPLPGQTPGAERVVEFVANGRVAAREVATVYEPENSVVGTSGESRKSGAPRVEMLKGGEFLRISVTRDGTRYLIHLPTGQSR